MARDPIAELVHLYADAVVHRNGDQWGSTWAPDAEWALGRHGTMQGRDAIVAFWHQAMGGFNAVVQTVLNGTYELDEAAGPEPAGGTSKKHSSGLGVRAAS